MATSNEEEISARLAEEWATYIESSRGVSFKQACAEASMQTIGSALQPFFATWRTSLMHSDLKKLRSMSIDSRLRAVVETIVIQDDCEQLDPWTSSKLPSVDSSYDIWPRNDAGIVNTNQIGIADLTIMLREKLLCPKMIKIRDYRIAEVNLRLAPEMAGVRNLIMASAQATAEPLSVAAIAKDMIEGAHLAVTSLAIQSASLPLAESSVFHSARFKDATETFVLGDPKIKEVILGLSPECQGKEMEFSMLRSAKLLLEDEKTPYWLEQIFYRATTLDTLTLSIKGPCNFLLTATSVVPKLAEFALCHTTMSANGILAMIASSKESLREIHFRQVTLSDGSTWRELLSSIANECRALTSITLAVLREQRGGYLAVDFRAVEKDFVPEECRPSLSLIAKGPSHNRRVTTLSYDGPYAGNVLKIVARHVQAGTPNENPG